MCSLVVSERIKQTKKKQKKHVNIDTVIRQMLSDYNIGYISLN